VPTIEPIPIDQLPPRAREIIEGGVADGLYATPVPLQIFAYRTALLESMHAKRVARADAGLLGGRIHELLRIRSAQLGECQPCMQSRKHESITDDDVVCLLGADNRRDLDAQERMAIRFLDLLSADHHAIDADFYGELAEVFSTAQIIELGFACAEMMGVHRLIHTLDVFGTDPPAIAFDADQIDAVHPAGTPAGANQ
jgi:alkylhydroperoxidase family enzyme